MAHEQAKALVRLGHIVKVFAGEHSTVRARYERTDDLYQNIEVCRIATAPEDYSPEFFNFLHPRVDDHFRNILQSFHPEIVHCHNLLGLSVKLPMIAKQHGVATVCTLHDFWGFCLRNTAVRPDGVTCNDAAQCHSCLPRIHDGRKLHVPMRFRKDFMKMALDHVDRFIAPSQFVADRYAWSGLSDDRISVIPNGIDIDRFHPDAQVQSPGDVRITYVGYFGAHKGVATLLEAMTLLRQDGPTVTLQLVGEGPEREAYLAQIKARRLHGRVRFLGKVAATDMPAIYAQSDIVVLPSVWDENQPVCLMEAMAAGLPVVASRKGGIPELINHGDDGLMFTAGDPRDLALQLTKFVENTRFREMAGQRGRQRVMEKDHDRQATLLTRTYVQCARPFSEFTTSKMLYAALGSLRNKMANEHRSLEDGQYPGRYFIPSGWITDSMPAISGVIFTGRVWSALSLVKIDAIIRFPRLLRLIADFFRQQQKKCTQKRATRGMLVGPP
jgi:glycosyltransferase involved in cell wall biosynthesis